MSYDREKRTEIGPRMTVGEFKALLENVPDQYEDCCSGSETFFMHVDDENEVISFDDSELEEDYDLDDLDDDEYEGD